MQQGTHLAIDPRLVGAVEELSPGKSRVTLTGSREMSAADRGLVHGGFTFGLADYAAMVAVNDPNVVLGAADCKFLAPVTVGQQMVAHAHVATEQGKKRVVEVAINAAGRPVFQGTFTAFVLPRHVLDA